MPPHRRIPILPAALLFYIFFSFPFFIRNINTTIYSIGLFVILIANLLWLFVAQRKIKTIRLQRGWPGVFLLLYGVYWIVFVVVSVYSLLNQDLEVTARPLIYAAFVVGVAVFLALVLDVHAIQNLIGAYINLLTLFSITGITLVIMLYLGFSPPSSLVILDSGSERQFYILGYVWEDTWIGSLIGLARLQSYSDEAGTFAFALVPAIIFAVHRKYFLRSFVLVLAVVLTFSVGALSVLGGLALLFKLTDQSDLGGRLRNYGSLLILVMSLSVLNFQDTGINDFFSTYLGSKFGSDGRTSLGDRVESIEILIPLLVENPIGLGAGALSALDTNLAVGWLVPLVEGGWVAFAFYVAAFGMLFVKLLPYLFKRNQLTPYAYVLVALMFSALQRAQVDATVWHWFWLIAFLKEFACQRQIQISSRVGREAKDLPVTESERF